MGKISIFILLVFSSLMVNAQQWIISGKITDENSIPIPFASVFIKSTTRGVSANAEGIYAIKVDKSPVVLVFSAIAYQTKTDTLQVNSNYHLDKILQSENYILPAIVIKANAEDPAYRIIRNTIAHRKAYLQEVTSYQVDVYIKGLQKLVSAPKKFFGRDMQKTLSLDSNRSGILYLSESQSKFSWMKPDKIKEEMVSSKVSGRNNAFSFNKASDVRINFYENLLLENSGLSNRSFVSPIAENALFYYQYKLLGKSEENGLVISKIQVIPKRKNDPVFRGVIYIVEDLWRLKAVDVSLTKEAGISFIDTLKISQNFIKLDKYFMPNQLKFDFKGNVFGFKFKGYFVSFLNNYKLNETFPKGYFTNEILKINKAVNEKDSIFWINNRPIPLTDEEQKDYVKKDSIALRRTSKTYLDSVEKANNNFTLGKILLTNYSYKDRFNRRSIIFSPIIPSLFFNTVEGAGLKYDITFLQAYEDKRNWSIRPQMRYGFANRTLTANLRADYRYNPAKRATIGIGFGTEINDLNNRGTMSLFSNTVNTLFYKTNYLKLYQRGFFNLNTQRELADGLQAFFSLEYTHNEALQNHNLFTFRNLSNSFFTSNNPLMPFSNTPLFDTYHSATVFLKMTYSIGQKYISTPTSKIYTSSKYPKLTFEYKKGLKNRFGGETDYDFMSLEVFQERIGLDLFGNSAFTIGMGGFLNNRIVPYPEFKHFQGNNAAFFPPNLRKFSYLDFYKYSTDQYYLEGHYEHNFAGFILNKVPLLRKLKLEEIVGINYLSQPGLQNYSEIYFGIRRLMFGLSYGFAFDGNRKVAQGIRYTYAMPF